MTTTTETIRNIKESLYSDDQHINDIANCDGVMYCAMDRGSDMAYILTESGDLLVVDTDIMRVRTSDQMEAAGYIAANVSSRITDALGVTINDDWTVSPA